MLAPVAAWAAVLVKPILRPTTAHTLLTEASGPLDSAWATQRSQPAQATRQRSQPAQATRHRGSGVLEQLPNRCGTPAGAAAAVIRRCGVLHGAQVLCCEVDGILTTLLHDTSIMELLFSLLQQVRPSMQRLLLVQQVSPPTYRCHHKKPEATQPSSFNGLWCANRKAARRRLGQNQQSSQRTLEGRAFYGA